MKRKHTKACCNSPDVKYQGRVTKLAVVNHQYNCRNCNRTWTEFALDNERKKG